MNIEIKLDEYENGCKTNGYMTLKPRPYLDGIVEIEIHNRNDEEVATIELEIRELNIALEMLSLMDDHQSC